MVQCPGKSGHRPVLRKKTMSKEYKVGLVGVGAVGAEMIKVLKDRRFPCGKVQVFASRERDEEING